MTDINPAIFEWNGPHGLPEFGRIASEDFEAAFDAALERDRADVNAVANSDAEPTFENTIVALERGGRDLQRVSALFWNLSGTDTNETLQALQREVAPRLSRHGSETARNAKLFRRIDELWDEREQLGLSAEQERLLERTWKGFVRAGAKLGEAEQTELADVNAKLAELGARFSQNLLKDEADWHLSVDDEAVVSALPAFLRSAMRGAARERELEGHVVTTSRSVMTPFLTFCPDRDWRRRAFEGWTSRGDRGGETDNNAIVAEIVGLRQRRATLLGYESFAHFKLENQMAGGPDKVLELLEEVWSHALPAAERETKELQAVLAQSGANHDVAPWDWLYLSEKVREERFDFDEAELKSYLALNRMVEAAFDVANRLFGLRFEERAVPAYHPDVRVWEVLDADGSHRAMFLGDYFARPSKRSGAWMTGFQGQHALDDGQSPIIVNVMNFAKPSEGEPALLSFDDARTLFHEFGHALHGMLSEVTYPSLAGTSVARDFVELPSQLFEHWLTVPEVLRQHARHVETDKPLPQALLDKVIAAQTFNAGYDAVEFTSSALVDMAFHSANAKGTDDPNEFTRRELESRGMPAAITMRHRTPHFAHVWSGDGYSAGYYSYMWSEVLDADAFRAFEEAGSAFDAETADRLRRHIYSVGGSVKEADTYRAFRGAMPSPQAMLEKRGLTGQAKAG